MLRGKHEKEDTFVTIQKKNIIQGRNTMTVIIILKSTKLTPVKEKVISQEGEYFSSGITEPELLFSKITLRSKLSLINSIMTCFMDPRLHKRISQ